MSSVQLTSLNNFSNLGPPPARLQSLKPHTSTICREDSSLISSLRLFLRLLWLMSVTDLLVMINDAKGVTNACAFDGPFILFRYPIDFQFFSLYSAGYSSIDL